MFTPKKSSPVTELPHSVGFFKYFFLKPGWEQSPEDSTSCRCTEAKSGHSPRAGDSCISPSIHLGYLAKYHASYFFPQVLGHQEDAPLSSQLSECTLPCCSSHHSWKNGLLDGEPRRIAWHGREKPGCNPQATKTLLFPSCLHAFILDTPIEAQKVGLWRTALVREPTPLL